MQPLWFKAKTYGWGWTPASWQGWVTILLYGAAVAGSAFLFLGRSPSTLTWIAYGTSLAVCTAALIAICCRTGEKPRWRWGVKK